MTKEKQKSTETNKYIQRACKTGRREALEGINTLCKAQYPPYDSIIRSRSSSYSPPVPLDSVVECWERRCSNCGTRWSFCCQRARLRINRSGLLLPLKLH